MKIGKLSVLSGSVLVNDKQNVDHMMSKKLCRIYMYIGTRIICIAYVI